MDIALTKEEERFRSELQEWLKANLTPELKRGARLSPGVFAEPDVAVPFMAKLNEEGWLAYQWPEAHGGTGWSATKKYIFEKELALAGAPNSAVMGTKLVAPVLWTFGSDAQKDYYLPRILSGEDYWCQGFSEPGSGSDLASLSCRARRDGDKYVVDGSKIWTTHAQFSNRMFALVRTDNSGKKQAGISFLLIDLDTPGISVRPIHNIAGDHDVNQVFLENVEVPVENLVGEEGAGWAIAKFLLENERGGSCHAPKLGHALDVIERAAADMPDSAGGMLADDLACRRRVARLRLRQEALEMIELKILANVAKGRDPGPQTSLTKLIASSLNQDIDLLAVDLYGPRALQLPVERPLYGEDVPEPIGSEDAQVAMARYLNSRAWSIFGGTNEVQSTIIAKTVLGM